MRVIKKYPNRRLYDTTAKTYITLDDVKQLVLKNIPFRVVDAKTDVDVSKNILLQILCECEDNLPPIFSNDVLQHLIRLYNDNTQDLLGKYLEQAVSGFIQQRESIKEHYQEYLKLTNLPLQMFNNFFEMQKSNFYNAATRTGQTKKPQKKSSSK